MDVYGKTMKPISEAWYCQIELTNVCGRECIYCSRYDRHIRKDQRFFMDLAFLEKAVLSLEGFKGRIGIIGGEPVLHPQFKEVCLLLQRLCPKKKLGLWTSGGKNYKKWEGLIRKTFGMIAYNEHNLYQQEVCKHQPITIAIGDVVEAGVYRDKLIDDCWVQDTWCPAISPKGAFFCEVACALDIILDGPGGYCVEPGWWKRIPKEFKDQVDRYCLHCGMAIPLKREYLKTNKEKFSPGNFDLFKQHNLLGLKPDEIEAFDKKLTISEIEKTKKYWDPGNYRGDLRKDKDSCE